MRRGALVAGLALIAFVLTAVVALRVRERAYVRLAAAEAAAAMPLLATGGRGLVRGTDGGMAALIGLAADRASAAGVRLSVKPGASAADVATVELEAHGGEDAIRRFAATIEHGRPLVRLARWSIQAEGSGLVRLRARVVAPSA